MWRKDVVSGASTARAPGKLILCGEHAVVHGCPAVAMAVNRYAECTVQKIQESKLVIEAPAFCVEQEMDMATALELYQLLQMRYREFLDGRRTVQKILDHSGQLLVYAAMCAWGESERKAGLHLRLQTDLPVGCGMGSSAAVASAVVQAAGACLGSRFDRADLYERVMNCERLQHGRPSGVDAYASIYGGCMRYRRNREIEPLNLKEFAAALVHTGAPEASTGECVEQVRPYFTSSVMRDRFERVAEEMTLALLNGDAACLIPLVRLNHRLLVEIGVVPERVQRFVKLVEEQGGAAKICGAGSIRGQGAGMLWVLSEAPSDGWNAEFGYTPMRVFLVR